MPPSWDGSISAHLCLASFPPLHVLLQALAINPAQIPENMIFRLGLGPPCISESVLEVVPHTCRAGVFLQASSEHRVLPLVSLLRVAALASQGC